MRVIVAALDDGCPAHLALTAEGVEHEVVMCKGEFGFGENLATLWQDGQGFVLLEHDVAPWVGAVQQLKECPRDWCAFRYPKSGYTIRSLGCTKFSTRLLRTFPHLSDRWGQCAWDVLESHVLRNVADALWGEEPSRKPVCTHSPPVAHVRRLGD